MFNNDKHKILLILKDKLIFYLVEELKYKERINDWENKSYADIKNKQCYSEQAFDKTKKDQIKWSYEQYNLNHNNSKLVEYLIKEIEKI